MNRGLCTHELVCIEENARLKDSESTSSNTKADVLIEISSDLRDATEVDNEGDIHFDTSDYKSQTNRNFFACTEEEDRMERMLAVICDRPHWHSIFLAVDQIAKCSACEYDFDGYLEYSVPSR